MRRRRGEKRRITAQREGKGRKEKGHFQHKAKRVGEMPWWGIWCRERPSSLPLPAALVWFQESPCPKRNSFPSLPSFYFGPHRGFSWNSSEVSKSSVHTSPFWIPSSGPLSALIGPISVPLARGALQEVENSGRLDSLRI